MPTHTMTITVGMPMTPMTNSRSVRPLEMVAMKDATKGEKAMHQHQMKTVQFPFQESDHVEIPLAATEGSV
jgi:hypothetical protein